ncbi:hypothetical protein OSTOST_02016 [Ostertagia ostertagi]
MTPARLDRCQYTTEHFAASLEDVLRTYKHQITVLFLSAFLVWRWGLHGFGTHLSVALALILLVFNAYLGARTWADLHFQNEMYLKYHIIYMRILLQRNVSHTRPVVGDGEKFRRNTPSPVWIERNPYCGEQEGGGVVK